MCYVFGKLFVEFWVVKLSETLSLVFLGVHYYGGLTFIRGLNDYVVSFSKIFESFSFLLGQGYLSCYFYLKKFKNKKRFQNTNCKTNFDPFFQKKVESSIFI